MQIECGDFQFIITIECVNYFGRQIADIFGVSKKKQVYKK